MNRSKPAGVKSRNKGRNVIDLFKVFLLTKTEATPRTPAVAVPAKVVKRPHTKATPPPNIEASFGGLAGDDEAEEVNDEGVQDSSAIASKVSSVVFS